MANDFTPVIVKHVVIGEGAPKLCVPLVGRTTEQLQEEARFLQTADVDVVEWRADFFEHVDSIERVRAALLEIRAYLPSVPMIFTFRTAKEGGEREIDADYYVQLNQSLAASGQVDLIDIELFSGDEHIQTIVDKAHQHHTAVIISNHDFQGTPPKEEMISRLRRAQELGGDLLKLAVMPTSAADVIALLDATVTMREQYAERPLITMSMGGQGLISRLAGELVGSALTFGAVQRASAPGQIPIADLRGVLNLLHNHSK
ncbi:type I 3-dehydroquinate dehydratase [Paenibacillus sp. WLX2291]|uniref:type I 3-dehydroquinate dehydratase n=1 Tax=Paenibacillus sp. WLX2291 TaxID=3296934 RepID=UPI003983EFE8